jgi:hypothetical protein
MTRRAGPPRRDAISARLMDSAREEADRARHGYVGCEHLLLALLTDKDPTAKDILAGNGIRLPAARAAVGSVISAGHGDGPRWNAADLLATLGVDLPAIQRQMRADYGPHVIDELYRSPVGRRLPWGPLCGPQMAPGLKKALFGARAKRASRPAGMRCCHCSTPAVAASAQCYLPWAPAPACCASRPDRACARPDDAASPLRPVRVSAAGRSSCQRSCECHSDRDADLLPDACVRRLVHRLWPREPRLRVSDDATAGAWSGAGPAVMWCRRRGR